MSLYFINVTERNPFLINNRGYYFNNQFYRPYDIDAPCFLNQLIFKNTNTSETFQADCPGSCISYDDNRVDIIIDPRDYLRMVSVEFINATSTDATSTNIGLEMYTSAELEAPFYVQIEPNDTFQCDVRLNLGGSVGISYSPDYWINEEIIIIHFTSLIDVATVNASKLSLSRDYYDQYGNNTVNITGGEILNESPGLALSVAIRLTSSDQVLLASKGICTAGRNFIRDCYLTLEEGFAASYYGEENSYFGSYSVSDFGSREPSELKVL